MKTAYFDCFAGVSGDMTLGALVDLGADLARIDAAVRSLGLDRFSLEARPVRKAGLGGTQVVVHAEDDAHERHLHQIEAMIDRGGLSALTRERARRVFRALAEAEAKVHRVPLERVHLHEVGAIDAIVDVVGACVGLELLGIERVAVSPVTLGRGMTRGEHGPIPVPGPATMALLAGKPVREGPVEAEMTTPTGAAIVAALGESFGAMPAMRLLATGYGAGSRDFAEVPNLLRIVLGEAGEGAATQAGTAVLVEANLDDASPQLVAFTAERLLAAGALDVWTTAATMKKGRSGHVLSVLAPADGLEALTGLLFAETTTLGVRFAAVERRMLGRRHEPVDTPYGPVRVKVGDRAGAAVTATPEYDDCAAAAARSGVALREVQAAALAAWRARAGQTD